MAEKQNHDFHEDGNDLADRLIEKLKKETEKIHSADSDAEGDSVSKVGAEDEKERSASDDESDLNELLKINKLSCGKCRDLVIDVGE